MAWTLYRFYDATGILLYVGCTGSFPYRLFGHIKAGHWGVGTAMITVRWFETKAAVISAEKAAIKAERPLHNSNGYGRKRRSRRRSKPLTSEERIARYRYCYRCKASKVCEECKNLKK